MHAEREHGRRPKPMVASGQAQLDRCGTSPSVCGQHSVRGRHSSRQGHDGRSGKRNEKEQNGHPGQGGVGHHETLQGGVTMGCLPDDSFPGMATT